MAYKCDIFNDKSCVAFYTFEWSAADACGNYNGIWHGNEKYDKGIIGLAAKFDGNSYIDTGYKTSELINNKSFSLWIKADPNDNNKVEFFGHRNSNDRNSLSLYWDKQENKLELVSSGGTDYKSVQFNGINDIISNWTHICGVYENGKQTLYVNGVKVGTSSLGQEGTVDYNLYIGWANNNDKLVGLIDYVRFFNRVLTDNEVKILYNEAFKLKNIQVLKNRNTVNTLNLFGDNSCVAAYTFDNQTPNDLSRKYNGIWYGTEKYDTGIFNGYAAKFDTNQVIVLDNTDIIDNMQKFMSLWFRLDKIEDEKKILLNIQQDDAGSTNFEIYIDKNRKIVIGGKNKDHSDAVYTTVFTSTEPIELNKFYHLVVNKINNTTYNVYLNQKLIGSFDFTFYVPMKSYRQTIGAFIDSADYSSIKYIWNGLIDQIRIFNRTLTDNEIKNLYKELDYFELNTDKYKKIILFNPKSINLNEKDFFYDNSGILNLPLENNAKDLLNNYNGIWQGTEQYRNNIFFGNAYFDGNSWIELPDNLEKLFTKNNSFTITGWFKFHSFENWSRIFDFKDVFVFSNKETDSALQCSFKPEAIENDDYSKEKYIVTSRIDKNLWYFYAITWDGNDLDIILKSIDNQTVSITTKKESTSGTKPKDSVIKNYIGHSNNSSNKNALFKGEQARIKIFNRVLTQEEIDYLFNEGGYLISSECYTTDSKRENLIIGLDFTKRKLFYEVPGLYQNYLVNQSKFDIPVLENKNYILEIEHQTSSSVVTIKDQNTTIFNQELKHGVLASIIEDSQKYFLDSGINITNPGVASDIFINKNEIALFAGEAKDDILGFVNLDNTIEIIENNYDLKSKFKIHLGDGQFVKKFDLFRYSVSIPKNKKGLNIDISNINKNEEIYMIIPITSYYGSNGNRIYFDDSAYLYFPRGTNFLIMKIINDKSIINKCMYSNFNKNIDIDKRNLTIKNTGKKVSLNMYLYPQYDNIYVHGIYFTKKPLKILSSIWPNIQLPIVDSYYYSINSKLKAIYY